MIVFVPVFVRLCGLLSGRPGAASDAATAGAPRLGPLSVPRAGGSVAAASQWNTVQPPIVVVLAPNSNRA